jgi:DNA recombination protein RmuC
MQTLFLLLGMAIGGGAVWLFMRARVGNAHEFEALSARALRDAQQSFLQLAQTELGKHHITSAEELEKRERSFQALVKPVVDDLGKVRIELEQLERVRRESQGSISTHMRAVAEGQETLRRETANLVTALRTPDIRGRWGEMQLRRVCEAAGMVDHCDFTEQKTIQSDDGRLRPDLIVHLPGGKDVVVDAKVPLVSYLSAVSAADAAESATHLANYARHIRDHVAKLSSKAYWSQFSSSPEFVVMFLPGEALFSTALEQAPTLIEDAAAQNVLIASPTTLIAMLRSVSYGWRQETVAESARAVSDLGRELYSRLGTMVGHFTKLGRSLEGSVRAYNETVGSLESRVLVTARRLSDHGVAAGDKELPEPPQIETAARSVPALEDDDGEAKVHRFSRAAG